jgi:hypothetical protein
VLAGAAEEADGEESVIAALYVETGGCYFDLPDVDPWDEARDAREYAGPHPVVAHPPCQRWGRYSESHPIKGIYAVTGDDGGCFRAALTAVQVWGGVLEHPAHSKAFAYFGLPIPRVGAGWTEPDKFGGRSCYVEQGHYGHMARKATWLYACGIAQHFCLNHTRGEQKLPQWMIDRYGYEKARRIGVVAMVGGKDKTKIRNATPTPFRDVLIAMARSAEFT